MSDFLEGIRANGTIEKLTKLYYLLISTNNVTNIHLLVLFVNWKVKLITNHALIGHIK
jgi:hypothetical protein